MMRTYEAYFFTATALEWKMLLKPDKYKDILIDSLAFLVAEKRILIHGFVLMDNHIHLIWHICYPNMLQNVQRDFLKYTAQQIKFDLQKHHPDVLNHFEVNAKDRKYQFWERNPLSVPIWSEKVLLQKLHYIHENPVRAGIVKQPEDYFYSSAGFYMAGTSIEGKRNIFPFLSHYYF